MDLSLLTAAIAAAPLLLIPTMFVVGVTMWLVFRIVVSILENPDMWLGMAILLGGLAWVASSKAFEFELIPKYGPIGELPLACYYAFPEGQITVLRPGTVLNVNPDLSDVTNSTIPTTARIECDWCVVTEWRMDDTGKSIITCEERR